MKIITTQITNLNHSSTQKAISEINDSIKWEDKISGQGLLALAGQKIVGYIKIGFDRDKSMTIDYLAVHKDHQRKGIGKKLLSQALAIAEERECSNVELTSTSEKANNFYKCSAKALRLSYSQNENLFYDSQEVVDITLTFEKNTPKIPKEFSLSHFFSGFYTF